MAPELLILALDYYRTPLRYPSLGDATQPLPESFDSLISAFGSALSARNIGNMALSLETTPADVKRASLFFIRQVLLAPESDLYRILGLSHQATAETIRQHYHLLVRLFHPDRSAGSSERDATYTARINEAYSTLRNPTSRQQYDRDLAVPRGVMRTGPAPRDAFRPSQPFAPDSVYNGPTVRFRARDRRPALLLAGGMLGVAVVLVLAIWASSSRPTLRTNPELANESIARPSFLRERTYPETHSHPDLDARPAIETIADPAQQETHQQTPAPAAFDSAATTQAGYATAAPPNKPMTAEEIRAGALSGLDSYSETLVAAADQGPTQPVLPFQRPPAQSGPKESPMVSEQTAKSAPRPEPETPAKTTASEAPRIEPTRRSQEDRKVSSSNVGRDRQARAQQERPIAASESKRELVRSRPPPKQPDPRKPGPKDLIARLTRSYQEGDLRGFVDLFTADARVSDGSGTAFIRADYAKFFAETFERRLSVRNLEWHTAGKDKTVGTGTYRADIKDSTNANWRHSTGAVQIELVPWKGSYKISKFIHH